MQCNFFLQLAERKKGRKANNRVTLIQNTDFLLKASLQCLLFETQNISSPRNNGKNDNVVFLASHQWYFTCIIEWTTLCFELYYLFPFPSLDLKKQGEDIPLTVPCESWSVDYRPSKGVEVVKSYGHCYNAVLEQEKNIGEEVAQSLPLILSNSSGIERANISGDWVHKGQRLWHRERKKAGYKQNPHTVRDCSSQGENFSVPESIYHYKC